MNKQAFMQNLVGEKVRSLKAAFLQKLVRYCHAWSFIFGIYYL